MNKAYIKMIRNESRKDRFEGFIVNTLGMLILTGGTAITVGLLYGFTVVMLGW